MWNQFYIPNTNEQNAALKQYCRMEHVLPGDLKCAVIRRDTIRIKLETLAFHGLQHIDKSLDYIIKRLMTDLEHKGRPQGDYS